MTCLVRNKKYVVCAYYTVTKTDIVLNIENVLEELIPDKTSNKRWTNKQELISRIKFLALNKKDESHSH
jgi:hypothetical protein